MAKDMDGETIEVGMCVGFKASYEEYGKVAKVSGRTIHIEVYDDNTGDSHIIREDCSRVWVEE